jgi:hypothetical protein
VADITGVELHLGRAVELAEVAGDPALLAEAVAMRELGMAMVGRGVDEAALDRALALEDPDREVPFQLRPSVTAAHAYESTGSLGPRPRAQRSSSATSAASTRGPQGTFWPSTR